MKARIGQHISFSYKGKQLHGMVLNDEKGKFVLKLDSGYNMTVGPDQLKEVKELKVLPKQREARTQKKQASGLPKVALLHTGGTVASRVDYETGAVIAQYTAEEILDLYPELLEIADIKSELISNMFSEMMRFGHWNVLARAVDKAVKDGAQGVIITHGTDILHMTSAALSFALENCPVPVLLVGSQRSSDRPSSDAVTNLLCAVQFIAKEKFTGVALCMHEGIEKDDCVVFPACRVRKMHTSRRDAFKAINDTPFARVHYPSLKVERLRVCPADASGRFAVREFNEKLKIGLLQIHPHFSVEELKAYEKFDGLVLSLTGLGHAPTMATDEYNKENAKIYDELKLLAKKMPVVGAPQTIYGRVNMNVYSSGTQLIGAGVLGQDCDATPETAFVKLAWLLSNYDKKEVRKLYGENLRGEFSARSEEDGFATPE